MNEITIVTAYFNIKREAIKGFRRSDKDYLNYFQNWARINNNLVVFCESENKEEIVKIRKRFNLENKTFVIVVDDLTSLDIDLYESIKKTMKNSYFTDFMFHNKNPEVVNPLYNYLMCIKPLLVNCAIKELGIKGNVAWIDFGFNHNKKYYPNVNEFDFLWQYNFDKNKIHLFNLQPLNCLPIFEVVRQMESFIQGGTLIAHHSKWAYFWEVIRENMFILNDVGFADDDQVLYLMAAKKHPESFELHPADWNEPLKIFGGQQLTYISSNNTKNKIKVTSKIIVAINKLFKRINYLLRTNKSFKKV